MGHTALEMSDSSPLFVKITTDVFQDWIKKVETVIRRGQDQGAIRSDVDALALAQSVVAIIEGGIMLFQIKQGCRSLQELPVSAAKPDTEHIVKQWISNLVRKCGLLR